MKTLLLLFLGLTCVNSAKILAIFHMSSYSHFAPGQTLMNALVDQGHDVTMIAPYNDPSSKFKLVQLSGFVEEVGDILKNRQFFERKEESLIVTLIKYHMMGSEVAESALKNSNVQALLKSSEKFDVIIIERFFNEAFHGFCNHFNASCIIYSSLSSSYLLNALVRNPEEPAYTPQLHLGAGNPMDFPTRVKNTLSLAYQSLFFHAVVVPMQDSIMRTNFPNAPPLRELLYETDLVLLNSHLSYADVVPHVPSMVEIGGFHIKQAGKLPEDFQRYLDRAQEGVVYFSMGSVLKSRDVSPDKMRIFFNVFSKLNLKVLWKFDVDFEEKPDNVRMEKWVPQKEVLAHPNVKLFITHGGMHSTIESIYYGVPIVGMPVFGDQVYNMRKCENSGVGIMVDFWNLKEEDLLSAITTVISDKRYLEITKKKSQLMQDRPMKPIDTALYWIEHIIRHKGGKHLRSPALDLQWYQYMLIDVILFLATVVSIVVGMIYYGIRKICSRRKTGNIAKDKKRK